MVAVAPAVNLARLFELLEGCDQLTDGDPIDVLVHSIQCADRLSEIAPDDHELQLAGLFHDVGRSISGSHQPDRELDAGRHDRVDRHAEVGAALVGGVLGPDVARLVELHVPAKRYLVSVERAHRDRLSDASTVSLAVQGGPMDDAEIRSFERDPLAARAVALRRADEAAKNPAAPIATLSDWHDRADRWLA